MKKDIIYIDTEDDITTIIEKVKNAATSIVALVPPKRIGVLQSIVNLKLLQRVAETADKRLVIITNDKALAGLAAGLSLPVAKNLQSKPEVADIAALDSDDNDVIDGVELPEVAASATDDEKPLEISNETLAAAGKAADDAGKGRSKDRKKRGIALPNFDSFRKKLFIFGGLGVLLVAFLVWAIFFAPKATVAITARTNVINIAKTLQLRPDTPADIAQSVLPAATQQTKKTASVDFTPTGKKDVGEKATGSVLIKTSAVTILVSGLTVPAGTVITSSSGATYTTNAAVTFPKGDADSLDGLTVGVTASARGSASNGASGSATTTASGVTSVKFVNATSGGTDKTVTVVTEEDVAKAKEQLQSTDSNAIKSDLKKQFDSDVVAIDESFVVDAGSPASAPAVGAEASAAKLTAETTYTMIGVKRADLKSVYTAYLNAQLKNDTTQKIYEYGENATQFSQFLKTEGGYSVRATAIAQVGPNIDEKQLAESIKGKRLGEVRQRIEDIQGVENVEVNFWPFWVSSIPNNTNRTTITFSLSNGTND